AASGISIELFTLSWLLFLDRVRPGVPPTRGRLVGAAVAAAAATLVRFEAAVVAAGILAVVWSGWRRWIPALLPVLLLILFSVATGNAFSYRHGHFMYYTEFLKGSGIPIEI